MATRLELEAALTASGLPWCCETWWPTKPPAPPYVVLCASGGSASHGDNATLSRRTRYRLELYSHGRSFEAEAQLAAALDAARLPWTPNPIGVVDETDVYETTFSVPVVGD